jgi:hypothetical protein
LKQDVAEAEKRCKKTLDKHSKIYCADMRKKIKKLKTSDPKEYWKLLHIGFILPTSQMSGLTPELKIALNIFS